MLVLNNQRKKKVENTINILYTLQIFEAVCVMGCHIYITKCVYVNIMHRFFFFTTLFQFWKVPSFCDCTPSLRSSPILHRAWQQLTEL